jgi:hypothetical protein
MRPPRGFDEVMIVNPYDPARQQGVTFMQFYPSGPRDFGYYAGPPWGYYAGPPLGWYGEPVEYGYYGEPADLAEDPYGGYPYGYYGEPPDFAGWGQAAPYGEVEPGYGYAEVDPALGYYAEDPMMGAYAEDPLTAGYDQVDPVGYYAEEPPLGEPDPLGGDASMPEMVGYGEPEFADYSEEPLAEEYPGMGDYGEPDVAGYVREEAPAYNPGCPLPTNVAGFEEADQLSGYVRPAEVGPTCTQFTPPPASKGSVPEAFKPLW